MKRMNRTTLINLVITVLVFGVLAAIIAPTFRSEGRPDRAWVRAQWRKQLERFNAEAPHASDIEGIWIDRPDGSRYLSDAKDIRAFWAALKRLNPGALRVGPLVSGFQLRLGNGGGFGFDRIDWNQDTELSRVARACWKRGKPL